MKMFSTDCFKSKKFVDVLLIIVLCTYIGRMKDLLQAFLCTYRVIQEEYALLWEMIV